MKSPRKGPWEKDPALKTPKPRSPGHLTTTPAKQGRVYLSHLPLLLPLSKAAA